MDTGFDTKRLEAFSDAVMAVAITLMVLRISPPSAAPGTSLAEAFWNETVPEIIYFGITFAVIVLFWTHHHDLFKRLPERTPALPFALNMTFLALICLLPFGLEFFSAEPDSYLTTGVYAGLMAAATVALGALDRAVTGSWPADTALRVGVFLLAIPFAGLIGGWSPMLWALAWPIGNRTARRARDGA